MNPLVPSSDRNLIDNLIFVEWDVRHNIRAIAFAFASCLGRGDISVRGRTYKWSKYHADVRVSFSAVQESEKGV